MKLSSQYDCPLTPKREKRVEEVLKHKQPDLTLILENVHDPHNIAAILRTCDAVGVMEVFVINTKENTYRNFDQRKSSSASKWMMVHHFDSVAACMHVVRERYQKVYAAYLHESTVDLYRLDLKESVALVFGNEKEGVSTEILPYCDGRFVIPQVGMIQSLNVSVACAVTLYEAFRQKNGAGHYTSPRLSRSQIAQLLASWGMKDQDNSHSYIGAAE